MHECIIFNAIICTMRNVNSCDFNYNMLMKNIYIFLYLDIGSNPDHNTRPLMCVNIPVKIVSSNANLDTSHCSLQLTSVVPEFTSVPIKNDVSHSITDNVLSALTESSQVFKFVAKNMRFLTILI